MGVLDDRREFGKEKDDLRARLTAAAAGPAHALIVSHRRPRLYRVNPQGKRHRRLTQGQR
jgi:hypothetical protein